MAAWELYNSNMMGRASLTLYNRFNESSGSSAYDSSGSANNGTASRTNILNNAGGVYGNCAAFASASSDYIEIPDATSLKPTGPFTITGWVKGTTTGPGFIFSSWSYVDSKFAGIALFIDATGQLTLYSSKNTGGGSATDYKAHTTTGSVTDNQWHHFAAMWTGAALRTYLDGKLDKADSAWANAPAYSTANHVTYGTWYNPTKTQYMSGFLDDMALFNGTALNADEVKQLYEGRYVGEHLPNPNISGIYHLSSSGLDTSGSAFHLTNQSVLFGGAYGVFNSGGTFNGTSAYLTAGGTEMDWIDTNTAVTYSFWFNYGTAGAGMFMSKATNDGAYNGWGIHSAEGTGIKYYMRQSGTNEFAVVYPSYYRDTAWHQLYLSYNGGSAASGVAMYMDGAKVVPGGTSSDSLTVSIANGTCPFNIGARTDAALFQKTLMDEVVVFKEVVTQSKIAKDYAWSTGKLL